MLISAFGISTVNAAYDNMLTNGGFENGGLGWQISGGDAADLITSDSSFDGSKSMRFTASDKGKQIRSEAVDIVAGKTYELSYYERTDNFWNLIVRIVKAEGESELLDAKAPSSSDGVEWKKFSGEFTATENCKIKIFMMVNDGSDISLSNPVYVDGFSITEKMEDKTGEIVNGGFEYGTDLWETAPEFTLTTEDKYEGTYSVKSDGTNYNAIRRVLKTEKNKKYELSFYGKRASESEYGMVKLFRGNTESGDPLNQFSVDNTSWTRYSYVFKSGEDTEFKMLIFNGPSAAYYDNFRLEEIPAETPVSDGGFEEGGAGWNFGNKWAVTDSAAFSGKYSALLSGNSSSWSYLKQSVNVLPNTDYTVSFYAKSNYGWGAVVKVFDSTENTTLEFQGVETPDTWHYDSISFNSGNNESVIIGFMDNSGAAEGNIVNTYIDEVKIQRTKAVSEEYIESTVGGTPVDFSNKTEIKAAFLGGSITQGACASDYGTKRWSTLVKNHLAETLGKTVTEINEGWGGTGSSFGVYRMENMLAQNPDIVFVEFAVNDSSTEKDKEKVQKSMEGIVRQILSHKPDCAIVFVYTTTHELKRVNTINFHQEVANYYGIPTINIEKHIKALNAGGTNIDSLFADGTHPNDEGYKTYADYVNSVLDSGWNEAKTQNEYFRSVELKQNPMTYADYNNPKMVSTKGAVIESGWTLNDNGELESSTDGASFTYNFVGKSFGFRNSVDNGTISIAIDGLSYGDIGLSGAPYTVIDENLSDSIHTATITVKSTEYLAEGKTIAIKAFLLDNDINDAKVYIPVQTFVDVLGKDTSSIVKGGAMSAKCGIVNNTDNAQNVVLVTALYKNGKLVDVKMSPSQSVDAGYTVLLTIPEFSVPESVTDAKLFVFESMSMLKPLSGQTQIK